MHQCFCFIPQGEWKESGKKKKRTNTAAASAAAAAAASSNQKSEPVANHITENRSDTRERSKDREPRTADKADFGHRRGRRSGPLPPRHARGRGRDRGDFRENKENEEESNEEGGGRDRSFGRGRGRGIFCPTFLKLIYENEFYCNDEFYFKLSSKINISIKYFFKFVLGLGRRGRGPR